MPMSIRNEEVERLADELSQLVHVSKTEVIRQALAEKKARLSVLGNATEGRRQRLLTFLENRVWPTLPAEASRPWTKEEEERALGYGEHGEPV
jgi:antitoxin VapB